MGMVMLLQIGAKNLTVYTTLNYTLRSLTPICSSTTSTMFSEPCFKQTHTARQRLIKRKDSNVGFLVTSWLILE